MKTATGKYILAAILLLGLGMMASACAPKLNPNFNSSLATAMDAKKSEFQSCYEQALKKNRNVQGDMRLVLQFGPKQKQASDAQVAQTDITDEQMKQCVLTAAKGAATAHAPGVNVDAKYTVNFGFK